MQQGLGLLQTPCQMFCLEKSQDISHSISSAWTVFSSLGKVHGKYLGLIILPISPVQRSFPGGCLEKTVIVKRRKIGKCISKSPSFELKKNLKGRTGSLVLPRQKNLLGLQGWEITDRFFSQNILLLLLQRQFLPLLLLCWILASGQGHLCCFGRIQFPLSALLWLCTLLF